MKSSNPNRVKYSDDGKTLVKVPINFCGELILPQGITEIGDYAFEGCKRLKHVVLPQRLTKIGRRAFWKCGITKIEIPCTVKHFGICAFRDCNNLKEVIIHDGIEKIEDELFSNCAITEIFIPKSVTSLEHQPFRGCPLEKIIVEEGNPRYDSRENCNAVIETATDTLIFGSKNTKIPESVTSIDVYAFKQNENIESIYIPKNIRKLRREIFEGCTNLRVIEIDKDNPIYDSREGCNAVIETATDELIAGCSKTTIPNSVKCIGEFAFTACYSLTEIYIPDSVEVIDNGAFMWCLYLKSVRLSQNLKLMNTLAFATCISLTDIELPDSLENIRPSVFMQCESLTRLYIPKNVKQIYRNTFNKMERLEEIKVHPQNSVYDSREDCNAIIETSTDTLIKGCRNTIIPSSVKYIGQGAFNTCRDMEMVIIPEGIISIGEWAFGDCYELTQITLPSTLQSVEEDVFDCTKIKEIIVPLGEKKRFCKMEGLRKCKKLIVEKVE